MPSVTRTQTPWFRLPRSVPLPGKSRDGLSLRRNLVHSRRGKLSIEQEQDSTERHTMSQTHELNHWTTHDHWYKAHALRTGGQELKVHHANDEHRRI